jgi:hypothetical protein
VRAAEPVAPTEKVAGLPAHTVTFCGAVPNETVANKLDGSNNTRPAIRQQPGMIFLMTGTGYARVESVKMFFIKDEMVFGMLGLTVLKY